MLKREDLRAWQLRCLDKLYSDAVNKCAKEALIYACPGAGKTIAALCTAKAIVGGLPECRAIIVVTPNLAIRTQWIEAAKLVDIDLRELRNVRDLAQFQLTADGVTAYVVSYQQLQNIKATLAGFVLLTHAIVVLDEVHHTAASHGMRDGNAWGAASEHAFRHARFVIATTGTPFREETTNPIAFVHYNSVGEVIADIEYTYGDAIKDGVCRPIEFEFYDGAIEWTDRSGKHYSHDFSDHLKNKKKERERLQAAISMEGQFPMRMLEDAHAKLLAIRAEGGVSARAGGLVVAMGRPHADAIADGLEIITGKRPVVVHSKIDEAQSLIDQFRDGSDEWIVGIAMLSEGVDIKRLRVGVYMTNVRASLYFHQFCGRFARVQDSHHERSFVFLPQDSEIEAIARTIEAERCHALNEEPGRKKGPGGGGGGTRHDIQVDNTNAEPSATVIGGFKVTPADIAANVVRIREFQSCDLAYHKMSPEAAYKILVHTGAIKHRARA